MVFKTSPPLAKIEWNFIRLLLAAMCFCLCGASLSFAREAGWVPLETPAKDLMQKPGSSSKAAKNKDTGTEKKTARMEKKPRIGTVYEDQPLITEKELNAFVDVLPIFREWARKNGEQAHPVVNSQGKPDFLYSPRAAKWVEEHDFEPSRFFCIMGRMAAGLVIVEEGNDLRGTRPPDMPSVAPQELGLVKKHLGALLTAGGPARPIK